ncbi:MAG: RluA family pseudouridine synthase [Clostridiales Family XIII bacterium]|nr:RluA family pseudouridine synthase [Clostridiales Family XIII bacterium]
MAERHTIEITEFEEGRRLDRLLKKYLPGAPLSLIYRLIRKDVKVNGRRASQNVLLCLGDVVEIALPESALGELSARKAGNGRAKRQFKVVYEDEAVLAVSKPFGLLTHGDDREKKDTLANQVTDYLIASGGFDPRRNPTFSPAPANRLDRNTTGLVLFGKTLPALQALAALVRGGGDVRVGKYYLAVTKGEIRTSLSFSDNMVRIEEEGKTVTLPDGAEDGRLMKTEIRPVSAGKGYSLVEARLITGRTHQIRVQLAAAGYPIAGDRKYGDPQLNARLLKQLGLKAQMLHSWRLEFPELEGALNGVSGKTLTAAPPKEFEETAARLGLKIADKR